ncbi:hypothetical protein DB346_05430 [Verrucomicrobia bacterium LW23]|nr:hypothetical protein DB346_24330 [Verrucomicrobia bacterium LW23]PTY03322.1 hypothetical protein DB346_05430 [Verrucomicrobia bacterium LW23]
MLHYINSQSDPRRAVYEIYFAIGKDVALGLTEVDMAKRYGISKQAFSHGVVQCRKALGLPSLQRSEAACRKFALTHERQHGPRTCPVVAETVAIAA